MTCRHPPGHPDCSSTPGSWSHRAAYANSVQQTSPPETPDSEKYEILEIEQVGTCLVLKVLYPNCKKCSYEGRKVLVVPSSSYKTALKWKKIDPHFADKKRANTEAPSPLARFPASDEGWADAMAYAKSKTAS